jgi:ATP-dependent RNA helicase SUPV3L1/SUV3
MAHRIKAILGPTNTGKTYMAINAMLKHNNGMIGVPLRLLAREIYDQISLKIGQQAVALITGEEKYIPKYPKYYICTVEAMPTDIPMDFIAVDEIQLANDNERGHIFTKRIYESRGLKETIFLGSNTIEPILKKIIPDIEIQNKPRLSSLTYEGTKKISRLKKRSAIIAFSVNRVYEIADFVRQQNGGTAVVLGALSPRTRNAQVDLYQSGEADYLVATDAIGMGLNMDIDNIAFDSIKKFDGSKYRYLLPYEIGQIAGRAGRYKNNGSFCMTHPSPDLSLDIVSAVESHKFNNIDNIKWRNTNLKYTSIKSILDSLRIRPNLPFLKPIMTGEDHLTLEHIYENKLLDYRKLEKDELQLLWEICQIPDYRQTGIDSHTKIVLKIFSDITENNGYLDNDWLEKEVKLSAKYQGDIDGLSNKISFIRTCNFIANKKNWVEDTDYWQKKTRSIEDKLSDTLHERLMQRFIDKRTSILINHSDLNLIKIDERNKINVGNVSLGTVNGLKFKHQSSAKLNKLAKSKLNKIIVSKINEQSLLILSSKSDEFQLSNEKQILWQEMPIATIKKSSEILKPNIQIICDDNLTDINKKRIIIKLNQWLSNYINSLIPGLIKFHESNFKGSLSAIKFSMLENLGVANKNNLGINFEQLSRYEKKELRAFGIFIGEKYIYFKNIFDDKEFFLRSLLLKIYEDIKITKSELLNLKIIKNSKESDFYKKLGYFENSGLIIRPDVIEKLLSSIRIQRQIEKSNNFILNDQISVQLDLKKDSIEKLLTGLGFVKMRKKTSEKNISWIKKKNKKNFSKIEPNSDNNPFFLLKKINSASNS